MQENESIAGGTTERDESSSRTVTEESSHEQETPNTPEENTKAEEPQMIDTNEISAFQEVP